MAWARHSKELAVDESRNVCKCYSDDENNQFVVSTISSIGRTEINIILDIELSSW